MILDFTSCLFCNIKIVKTLYKPKAFLLTFSRAVGELAFLWLPVI